MFDNKINVLIQPESLLRGAYAYVEILEPTFVGGTRSRGGGWHEHPARRYKAEYKEYYAADVDSLIARIKHIYGNAIYNIETVK